MITRILSAILGEFFSAWREDIFNILYCTGEYPASKLEQVIMNLAFGRLLSSTCQWPVMQPKLAFSFH